MENQIKEGHCKYCTKKLRQRKILNILPYHNSCHDKYLKNLNKPKPKEIK